MSNRTGTWKGTNTYFPLIISAKRIYYRTVREFYKNILILLNDSNLHTIPEANKTKSWII